MRLSGAFKADTGSVSCGFENERIVLDVDDTTDDTADGGYFIANGKAIAKCICFLFLFFLGTNDKEIKYDTQNNKHDDGSPHRTAAGIGCGAVCGSSQKHGHGKFLLGFIIYISIPHILFFFNKKL